MCFFIVQMWIPTYLTPNIQINRIDNVHLCCFSDDEDCTEANNTKRFSVNANCQWGIPGQIDQRLTLSYFKKI